MKILFSPSETKRALVTHHSLEKNCLLFPYLYEKRYCVLKRYQSLLDAQDITTLQHLFGIKDEKKIMINASKNIFNSLTCKAVERYDGIAYKYLQFESLNRDAQAYIENNVMIFSNLFGPLLAGDLIPEYKLKQGESLDGFKTDSFYKEHFSGAIDEWIGDELLFDLRASFYEKFYTPKQPYITMKFLKDGKVLSHYAKAYRGKILREAAMLQPQDEKEFQKIHFSGLCLQEILQSKHKREYIFNIIV